MPKNSSTRPPVLIVAPFGRDAELIAGALTRANIACEVCREPRLALPHLSNGMGAILIEEEALSEQIIQEFSRALDGQPAWSDAPLIVLTKTSSGSTSATNLMARMRQPLGHATLLERPIRPETLVSTVETVLRARLRQFQVRDTLEKLQASEARYRSLILATASVVWATDVEGNVVEPLPSWESFTGQSFDEYRGRRWLDAIHPEDREAAAAAVYSSIRNRVPFTLDFRLRRHDGECRCVLARGVPVLREDSTVKEWVGTFTDIQERKDSEIALRNSERMALAGQMAATIAHEINNPLEAVTNLIYLISTRTGDEEIRQYAAMAERELGRVSEISGQALRFYRKAANPTATDVAELLQSLLQLFESKLARRSLQVHSSLQSGTVVPAFPNELRQLFANLISNAIDATRPGGEIHIVVRAAVNWAEGGKRGVRVLVADNGIGIPEKIRRRVFEPFVTTKGDSGTGLGLWVCDDIVRRHGGRLHLKSRTGERSGTVFSVFLPGHHQPEPQQAGLDGLPATA